MEAQRNRERISHAQASDTMYQRAYVRRRVTETTDGQARTPYRAYDAELNSNSGVALTFLRRALLARLDGTFDTQVSTLPAGLANILALCVPSHENYDAQRARQRKGNAPHTGATTQGRRRAARRAYASAVARYESALNDWRDRNDGTPAPEPDFPILDAVRDASFIGASRPPAIPAPLATAFFQSYAATAMQCGNIRQIIYWLEARRARSENTEQQVMEVALQRIIRGLALLDTYFQHADAGEHHAIHAIATKAAETEYSSNAHRYWHALTDPTKAAPAGASTHRKAKKSQAQRRMRKARQTS